MAKMLLNNDKLRVWKYKERVSCMENTEATSGFIIKNSIIENLEEN